MSRDIDDTDLIFEWKRVSPAPKYEKTKKVGRVIGELIRTAMIVMVTMKLDGSSDLSWWVIFSPVIFVMALLGLLASVKEAIDGE